MNRLPKEGYLHDYGLAYLMNTINRWRMNGILSVTAQGITRSIHFQDGHAVFATSTYDDDRLGEMLVKAGLISVKQYDEATERMKKSGKRLGSMFIELGYLTPTDLFWGVKYQVEEIIYSMFRERDGVFEFLSGEVPSEIITLDKSMPAIIIEGVRRVDDLSRIKGELPSQDAPIMFSHDPLSLFQNVKLSENEKKMLSLVDGKKTMSELLDASCLNSFEALRTMYILLSIGMITDHFSTKAGGFSYDDIIKPLNDSKEDFIAKVRSLHAVLDSLTPYTLLSLDEEADAEEIDRKFYNMAKQFHPDRFCSEIQDSLMRQRIRDVFDAIVKAYGQLRRDQVGTMFEGAEGFVIEMLKKAKAEIRSADFERAAETLEEALSVNPLDADCWNHLSLALSKLPNRLLDAEDAIQKALEIDPSNSDYVANLGLLYLKLRRYDAAKAQFEQALGLDEGNAKAQKGLSMLLTG